MDSEIIRLVDRLEALINGGNRVPLSAKVMINEQEALDILDQMRAAVPEEIQLSQRTLQERDRILAQAQDDAERMMERAQEEAYRMLEEKGLVSQAQGQRTAIVGRAEEDAARVKQGADTYAREVLSELEDVLTKQLSQVRRGLNTLNR